MKIVAADEVAQWTIADHMAKDPELRAAVQVVGTHYPHCHSTPMARQFRQAGVGQRRWTLERELGRPQRAVPGCPAFNRNYAEGKMTATIIWSPITSYYDILPLPGSGLMRANQPWSGHYDVQPAVWMTAHTTQFIEPGWKYLGGSACGLLQGGGSHVAAVSPEGQDFSVVVETIGAKQAQVLAFKLAGGLAGRRVHSWRSTAREQFVPLAEVPVVDGTFSLTAEPEAMYSLTTTDGQRKGVTDIPPARPFPLPYRDEFDGYRAGATPKYLFDFFGAFEVKAGGGRAAVGGNCLQQVITQRGIAWCGDGDPLTVLGSPESRDYEVACDVCFDFKQAAWLYGRIKTLAFGKQQPQGYALRIGSDGTWTLAENQSGSHLAGGKFQVAPGSWHRLGLRMSGNRMTVVIDGKEAGSAVSDAFHSGLAGLGCGWEEVKFGNLSIEGEKPHHRCRLKIGSATAGGAIEIFRFLGRFVASWVGPKGLHALLLAVEDLEELPEFRGVEDVHDLRADLAELELSRFLAHLLAEHEHDAQHGAGQPHDAGEVQKQVLAIGPIGHVEQLLAELLDGQLVENAMLAEADHDHIALLAEPQEVTRRSAASCERFRPAGETSIPTVACDIAGSRHGRWR